MQIQTRWQKKMKKMPTLLQMKILSVVFTLFFLVDAFREKIKCQRRVKKRGKKIAFPAPEIKKKRCYNIRPKEFC